MTAIAPHRRRGSLDVVNDFDADPTGSVESTDGLREAIAATESGWTVDCPPGTYLTDKLSVNGRLNILGDSPGSTVFKAKTGATGPLIDFTPAAATRYSRLSQFSVDLTLAKTIVALEIHNANRMEISGINVNYGSKAFVLGATGELHMENCRLYNQTDAAIFADGESTGELYISDIDVHVEDAAVTLAAAFLLTRTTAADIGGLYLDSIRATKQAGSITDGFVIGGAAAAFTSAQPLFMSKCVADGVTGKALHLDNVQNGRFWGNWFTTGAGGTAVMIDDGQDFIFLGNWLDPSSTGYCFDFANTPIWIDIIGNRCNQGTAFHLPASGKPAGINLVGNRLSGTTISNDVAGLQAAQNQSNVVQLGFKVYGDITQGDSGPIFTTYAGSPEGNKSAPMGSLCTDSTNGEVYVKKTGTGNTGWKLVTHA